MRTPPADLPEPALRAALAAGWSLAATTLTYRPVGFGSHHWEAVDAAGTRWFVTVDDLRVRAHDRLRAALLVAQALRAAGRDFVVAPIGEPAVRFGDHFAVSLYPFLSGESADAGEAIIDLLVAVHTAPPEVRDLAGRDDHAIAFREALVPGNLGPGPYARPAADLITARAGAINRALSRHDELVAAVPPDLVLTHGEPHPGNTMRTAEGWLLIDWDTARAAPPERDLWDLDPSSYAAYTAATGHEPRPDVLEMYRLRWDLSEIAAGLARFRRPHGATADDEQTWANLVESAGRIGG